MTMQEALGLSDTSPVINPTSPPNASDSSRNFWLDRAWGRQRVAAGASR